MGNAVSLLLPRVIFYRREKILFPPCLKSQLQQPLSSCVPGEIFVQGMEREDKLLKFVSTAEKTKGESEHPTAPLPPHTHS